jgi:hypothetical protein
MASSASGSGELLCVWHEVCYVESQFAEREAFERVASCIREFKWLPIMAP